jgi:hypothetical protein
MIELKIFKLYQEHTTGKKTTNVKKWFCEYVLYVAKSFYFQKGVYLPILILVVVENVVESNLIGNNN